MHNMTKEIGGSWGRETGKRQWRVKEREQSKTTARWWPKTQTNKTKEARRTRERKKERKNGARSVRLATKFWTTANTKWHKGKKRTKGAMQGQEKEKKKECVWWWWWWWSRRKMLTS